MRRHRSPFRADPGNISLHTSRSSTSLSSSLSSSAASSMLAPLSNSSQSDIAPPDQSASSSPSKARLTSPAPRSSSLARIMGQPQSRLEPTNLPPTPPSPPPATPAKGLTTVDAARLAGAKLKRVFGGRRKTSDEAPAPLSLLHPRDGSAGESEPPPHRPSPTLVEKRLPAQPSSPVDAIGCPSPEPPTPPPKPLTFQVPSTFQVSRERSMEHTSSLAPQRPSGLPPTPGEVDREQERGASDARDWVTKRPAAEQSDQKDIWRKSDSTISHHTLRQNGNVGIRTPRPLSMAESIHSSHTIVSPNRRLSALFTDVELVMAEEEGPIDNVVFTSPTWPSSSPKNSPTSSLRSKKRRSITLNISGVTSRDPASPAAASSASGNPSLGTCLSLDAGLPLSSFPRDSPASTATDESSPPSPSTLGSSSHGSGNHVRGRLAAWTATTHIAISPPTRMRPLPAVPSARSRQPSISAAGALGLRQTAISITGGLAPAAGLAKRAVERMGRAFGGLGSAANNAGSSRHAPSSYHHPSTLDEPLTRTESRQSSIGITTNYIGKGKGRRTPNAPSASWSLISQTSAVPNDSDTNPTPSRPILGICLRGPIRTSGDGVGYVGGVVFGRDLQSCVRETAVLSDQLGASSLTAEIRAVGLRSLPALVVRSVQHIMLWGVQEEGLFRVNGPHSHVTHLRTAFDTGADYDMSGCSPGELDPHAVASVFKAYLRELPEPILTGKLMPYFEAAVNAECDSLSSISRQSSKGTLASTSQTESILSPSEPTQRGFEIRKPPSLSTLALPKFSSMQPSEALQKAMTTLLAQLPREYRDLMCTVAELIRYTASRCKENKMPLSNLLLVFCPSLHMSPQLLRVLCENESLWTGQEPPRSPHEKSSSGASDLSMTQEVERSSVSGGDDLDGKDNGEAVAILRRPANAIVTRGPIDTLYFDAEASPSFLPIKPHVTKGMSPLNTSPASSSPDTRSVEDGHPYIMMTRPRPARSPTSASTFTYTDDASVSSSAETLPTPLTSPRHQSFAELPAPQEEAVKKLSPLSTPLNAAIVDIAPLTHPLTSREASKLSPFQFPASRPLPTPSLVHRLSVPALSIPETRVQSDAPISGHSSRSKRSKKPSLNIFSKRSSPTPSASPDSAGGFPWSPYLQSKPRSEGTSSTPISAISAVTAQSTISILPPTLDLSIEPSDLQLGLGITVDEPQDGGTHDSGPRPDIHRSPSAASMSSLPSYPAETPIADHFSERSPTPYNSAPSISERVMQHHANPSTVSFASSYHRLSFEDREEEWSQSVLEAAQAGLT